MKIKIKSTILVLVCLLILNIPYLSQNMNNMINLVIESFLLIYMFTKLHTKHSLKSNIYVLLFWLLMVICTFLNFKFTSRTLNAFVTGAQYFLFFVRYFNCRFYRNSFRRKRNLESGYCSKILSYRKQIYCFLLPYVFPFFIFSTECQRKKGKT